MLDYSRMAAKHATYWSQADSANENTLNGFCGQFDIKDHAQIPSGVKNFLTECFPRKDRLDQIAITDINKVLNEVWQGAGSMATVVFETERRRQARTDGENADVKLHADTELEDFIAKGAGDPQVSIDNADQ